MVMISNCSLHHSNQIGSRAHLAPQDMKFVSQFHPVPLQGMVVNYFYIYFTLKPVMLVLKGSSLGSAAIWWAKGE
jgi:hypothetical protein